MYIQNLIFHSSSYISNKAFLSETNRRKQHFDAEKSRFCLLAPKHFSINYFDYYILSLTYYIVLTSLRTWNIFGTTCNFVRGIPCIQFSPNWQMMQSNLSPSDWFSWEKLLLCGCCARSLHEVAPSKLKFAELVKLYRYKRGNLKLSEHFYMLRTTDEDKKSYVNKRSIQFEFKLISVFLNHHREQNVWDVG